MSSPSLKGNAVVEFKSRFEELIADFEAGAKKPAESDLAIRWASGFGSLSFTCGVGTNYPAHPRNTWAVLEQLAWGPLGKRCEECDCGPARQDVVADGIAIRA